MRGLSQTNQRKELSTMNYSNEVMNMCTVTKGPKHGPAPIPEEGKWVKSYEIKDNIAVMPGVVSRKKQVLPLVEKNM